jgi:hypothetical protein
MSGPKKRSHYPAFIYLITYCIKKLNNNHSKLKFIACLRSTHTVQVTSYFAIIKNELIENLNGTQELSGKPIRI